MKEYLESLPSGERKVVFISYRSKSRELAQEVRSVLEAEGYYAVMWQPDDPWNDAVSEIVHWIDNASAVVAVRPSESSVWIEAEHRLAALCGTSVVDISSNHDLDASVARVAKQVRDAKPVAYAYWERGELADRAFGSVEGFVTEDYNTDIHTDPLGFMKMATRPDGTILLLGALSMGLALFFGTVRFLLIAFGG